MNNQKDMASKTIQKECIDIWSLLRDNPGMTKLDAYKHLKLMPLDCSLDSENILVDNLCPACDLAEFRAKHKTGSMCACCPVKNWPTTNGVFKLDRCYSCQGSGKRSAFKQWQFTVSAINDDDEISTSDIEKLKEQASYCAALMVEAFETQWEDY